MAPELKPVIGQNEYLIGPEVDLWAFGILLYEMCMAYKPTQVKNYKYGTGPIPFMPRHWKKLSKQGALVQDLIVQCL